MPKARETEYGRDSKYGPAVGPFGASEYFPETTNYSKYSEIELLNQAHRLAWSHGCPNPDFCIATYGLDYMLNRYTQCNVTLSTVVGLMDMTDSGLYWTFTHPIARRPEEPVGKYEPLAVPKSHLQQIAMGAGLYGYALPRILILAGKYDDWRGEVIASDSLHHNIYEAKTSDELLAGVTKDILYDANLDRAKVLSHILPQGVLEEENCFTIYNRFARVLTEMVPELAKLYTELTASQKQELGIAEVPALK